MNNRVYSKEEVLETFTNMNDEKLDLLYAADWNSLKSFSELVTSNKLIEGLGNFVNNIEVHDDSWLSLYDLSDESKHKYYRWLFKSTIGCIKPEDRKVGVKIRNNLPLTLEFHMNETFAKTLGALDDDVGAVAEFNRVRDEVIIPQLSERLNSAGFKGRLTDAVTTENRFESFRIEIAQVRTMGQYEATMTNQEYVNSKFDN